MQADIEYILFFLIFFIIIFKRERLGEGRHREQDTEPEAGSRIWAVNPEPDAGLEPTDLEIMTWTEVRCLTNWGTQVPWIYAFKTSFFI